MNSVSISLVSVALMLALPEACAAESWTLGSGKSVEILSVGPAASGDGRPSLQLTYQTLVPLTDAPTLRKEADEIWDHLARDADEGMYDRAVISAGAPATGGAPTDAARFTYERRDGSWRTLESPERVQKKLDAAFIKEFIDRLRWADQYHHREASLLYLADDWLLTATGPKPGDTRVYDRAGILALDRLVEGAGMDDPGAPEIVNVFIDPSGTLARVEERFNSVIAMKGHRIHVSGHGADIVQLHGDVMLWTKSQSVIEERTEASAD